jgi:hypothetical protein
MRPSPESYAADGYTVLSQPDGATVVWKYHPGNDLSLDGCLYTRRFNGPDGSSVIKLIPLAPCAMSALRDDDAVAAYVLQAFRG